MTSASEAIPATRRLAEIVATTTSADLSDEVLGHAQQLEGMLWGGADAFVVEPADPETLESTIRKVLRSHWPAGLATLVPPRDPAS